jgi:predicted dehydrogenase
MEKVKVGIIGCGNICGIYFKNLKTYPFLDVAACADLVVEKAKARAQEFGVAKVCTPAELLANPEIQVVVNLTIPRAHYSVALAALQAGKSVYNEKPLTIKREEAKKLVELAKKKKLRVGCAPDTFMGAGIQTCRKLIEDGVIGKPVAATAFMTCHGHESWHPDPEFYYKAGGGPMFDMGPYYLTAMVALMGPVKRVTGSARVSFPTRTISSQPKNGTKIKVDVPTHVAGVLDFAQGAVGTILTSFDVWRAELPRIEVYGSEGTLSVPDPNGFGGPVRLYKPGAQDWSEVALTHGYPENGRGMGVADMVKGQLNKRPHRASGELAFHVLDIMHAIHDASKAGRHVMLKTTCKQPKPLPTGLNVGQMDE